MRLAALLHVDAGPLQQGGGDSSSQSTWATGQERQNLAAALANSDYYSCHATCSRRARRSTLRARIGPRAHARQKCGPRGDTHTVLVEEGD
eukprot:COSAG03_NODE_13803_length_488_cov_0.537275_2_plen_90_part_01